MAYQSIHQLMQEYNTEDKCREWFVQHRWPNGVECPFCGNKDGEKTICRLSKGAEKGCFLCRACKKKFSVRNNSFMGKSRIPYSKWLMAIYFVINHKRGISSLQLARNIGVTQSTAWFMAQRIFNIVNSDNNILNGVVEMDEVYIGGAEKNKRPDRRVNNSNKYLNDKMSVLGMLERGGKVILRQYDGKQYKYMEPVIEHHIAKDATVYTDESPLYKGGINGRQHKCVNHSKGIYGIGSITTNRIEGMFSQLKRMILGIHVFVTRGHFKRYADMFSFRMDTRDLSEYDRLSLLMTQVNGTRIKFDEISCHGNPGTKKWFPHYGSKRKIVL